MNTPEANGNKKDCIRIGTHDGNFHCDEVLACSLLKLLPKYKNSEIIRTRDETKLNVCDIVVDVGAVFDPSKNRYDHHQKTFKETFSTLNPKKKWDIKLSSAGLIYFYFGEEVIRERIRASSLELDSQKIEELTQLIYDKIYAAFVREIDAIDNGIEIADNRRYDITTNLSSRVSYFNPSWNDKISNENECFEKAMKYVTEEFIDRVDYFIKDWWPARSIVKNAIDRRFEVDPSGQIIILESFAPWKSHLFIIEDDIKIKDSPAENIKYVLYQDKGTSWRIQCVSVSENSFTNRLSIKEEWKGLRDDELSKVSGISDCIFVHTTGFIGGAKTYESVLQMAQQSLNQN